MTIWTGLCCLKFWKIWNLVKFLLNGWINLYFTKGTDNCKWRNNKTLWKIERSKQGYSLPLLFILLLEVLNRDIRQDKRIPKVKIKREQCKLQMFADALMLNSGKSFERNWNIKGKKVLLKKFFQELKSTFLIKE